MLNNIYNYFKLNDYKSIDLCQYFSSICDCLSKNPIQEFNEIIKLKKTDDDKENNYEENNFKQLVYSQDLEEFILI